MRLELVDHPILIVDDEVPNLELMERFLKRKYKKVVVASDVEQALWYLETQGVHLIIADQRMPKSDGVELLMQARKLQPKAMRILITGYMDVETLTSAINAAQVFQVVTKPIDFKVLDMTVQRALEAHEAIDRERELFDAFVYAAVTAMEQRDPSTAGHSFRVALMTTGLAMAVDKLVTGPLASVHFSREDVEQIKYASLLHDFGKIGVPEDVLLKAKKLPPNRALLFEQRIRHATHSGQISPDEGARLAGLVQRLNEPMLAASAVQDELAELERSGLAEPEDMHYLRIEQGSLAPEERRMIESHVLGTVRFLKQIPWPRRLGRITEIAAGHHEKPNGRGYPLGTTDIPIESRMMAICDVYDALCASDRPYRVAATHERAVGILAEMRDVGELDGLLLDIFLHRRVFQVLKHRNPMRERRISRDANR
jgi:response regulator RpfG family c-di-GMP phosphodiesterase